MFRNLPSSFLILMLSLGTAMPTLATIYTSFYGYKVNPNQPVVVIVAGFEDVSLTHDINEIKKLIFGDQNSVKTFYNKMSYGKINIQPAVESNDVQNDGIIYLFTQTEHPNVEYLGSNGQQMTAFYSSQYMKLASKYIDYARYDTNKDGRLTPQELAVIVIYAGFEQSNVKYGASDSPPSIQAAKNYYEIQSDGVELPSLVQFGERFDGNRLIPKGVVTHELGHLILNLDDLYAENGGAGYGKWDLMARGGHGALPEGALGTAPTQLSGWSKELVGFATPRVVTGNGIPITLAPADVQPDYYKVWIDPYQHLEFFMLEHRRAQGIDVGLADTGLLISRINYRIQNNNKRDQLLIGHMESDDNKLFGQGDHDFSGQKTEEGSVKVKETSAGSITFGNISGSQSQEDAIDCNSYDCITIDNITLSGDRVSALVHAPNEDKSSIGYNEMPFKSRLDRIEYSNDQEKIFIMEIVNTARFADGIDLGLVANKNTGQKVIIGIATSLNQAVNRDFIVQKEQSVSPKKVSSGFFASGLEWTRILFGNRLDTTAHKKLYVRVTLNKAALAKDLGPKNGNFYTVVNGRTTRYPEYDLAMRLLVSGLNSNHSSSHNPPTTVPVQPTAPVRNTPLPKPAAPVAKPATPVVKPATPVAKPAKPSQNSKPVSNGNNPNNINFPDDNVKDDVDAEAGSSAEEEEEQAAATGNFAVGLLISLMLLLRRRTRKI